MRGLSELCPQVAVRERDAVSLGVPLSMEVLGTTFGRKINDHLCAGLTTDHRLDEGPLILLGSISPDNGADTVHNSDVTVACRMVGV